MEKYYIFNNQYVLCPDVDRVVLTTQSDEAYKMFTVYIHPMHAVLFSIFDGNRSYNECIKELARIFSMSEEKCRQIISPFLENKNELTIHYDQHYFNFPKNILVKNTEHYIRRDINPENFLLKPPYDFITKRAKIPKEILMVLNLSCFTDCFYCYANRKAHYIPLSTERICEIIEDARQAGVISFELSGGEVLLHKDWEKIIAKFVECGYTPDISTKVPVKRQQIERLYELGIRYIQVSLDSLNSTLLAKTLRVKPEYAVQIQQTIQDFDDVGFKIVLKSTLTKETCTIENVKEILNFAQSLKNIQKYTCSCVGYSHYKSIQEFYNMIPEVSQVKELEEYLNSCALAFPFNIIDDLNCPMRTEVNDYNAFKNRSVCSGNMTGLVIMPDGKVTVCEELYWNENFILGDLKNESIMEIWNSERAQKLAFLQQELMPLDSPCSKCQDFKQCRYTTGVCWKEIIALYGKEHWLYPDPRCPKAPEPVYNIFYDHQCCNNKN